MVFTKFVPLAETNTHTKTPRPPPHPHTHTHTNVVVCYIQSNRISFETSIMPSSMLSLKLLGCCSSSSGGGDSCCGASSLVAVAATDTAAFSLNKIMTSSKHANLNKFGLPSIVDDLLPLPPLLPLLCAAVVASAASCGDEDDEGASADSSAARFGVLYGMPPAMRQW